MQEWLYNTRLEFDWRKNTPVISPYAFNVQVKDYIGTPEVEGLTDLKISITPYFSSYIQLVGASSSGLVYQNGMNLELELNFNSYLNTLAPQVYNNNIVISITGKKPDQSIQIVDSALIQVIVNVFGQNQTYLMPRTLNFEYNLSSAIVPSNNFTINGIGDWVIILPTLLKFNAEIISGTAIISNQNNLTTIIGNGIVTARLTLDRDFANSLTVSDVLYTDIIAPPYDEANVFTNIPIQIKLKINESVDLIAPDLIEFYAVKNVTLAETVSIDIESNYDFELTFSEWITPSEISGSQGTNTIDINVTPAPFMDAQLHEGFVNITYQNEFSETITKTIRVRYLIDEFVSLPYSLSDFNFTLDDKSIGFFTENVNTYFQVYMRIKAFDFNSSNFIEKEIPFKVPLVKGRQTENIGLKIHRIMARFNEVTTETGSLYKSCEVELRVEEISYENREVIRFFEIEKIRFIAGITPFFTAKKIFLELHSGLQRVFPVTKKIVNLLLKSGNHQIIIKVNNEVRTSYYVNPGECNVYRDILDCKALNVKQGDFIQYIVLQNENQTDVFYTREFCVFPAPPRCVTVFWEDEYKLLQNLDASGVKTLSLNYESKQFNRFKNIVEYAETFQTIKKPIVKINTGFLTQDEHVTIDSICMSKRIFIPIDGKMSEFYAATKSITAIDPEEQTTEFSLEFNLNKKINEEVYYGRF